MTRRTLPAIALAALGILIVCGDASALTRRTRECITAARFLRRDCTLQCSNDLKGNIINCFGALGACPTGCFTDQSTCQLPVVSARTDCSGACNNALRTALQGCFESTDATACSEAARAQADVCNAACRTAAAAPLRACSDAFNDCLESCASPR